MVRPLILSLSLAAAGAALATGELGPGMPAPTIAVSDWVKGSPVNSFEKGRVYVVEFWATWCGPCRTSIPHITELAKKHADKVTVLGVSVWEQGDDIPGQVKKFVNDMGDKMDYHVALDTTDGAMANTWMRAAGQNGIPAAFIVNQEGTIAWIGHPMQMDKPLQQIVDGTFDVAAAQAEFAQKAAQAEQRKLVMERIAAIKNEYAEGNRAELNQELDDIAANNPQMQGMVAGTKLELAADHDPEAFSKMVETMIKGDEMDHDRLAQFVGSTAQMAERDPKAKARLPKAVEVAEAMLKAGTDDPIKLYYFGGAFGESGQKERALETLDKALEMAKKSPIFSDPASLESFKKAIEQRKAKYAKH